jgi:hypothetical protein
MDVIEQIQDDLDFLKSFVAEAKKGTQFLISVLAFMFLWNSHDEFLDHKRRYTINDLNLLVERSGLTIVKSRYMYSLVFPIVFFIRIFSRFFCATNLKKKSDLKKHNFLTNTFLKILCHIDRYIIFPHNTFGGLSIFCLAEKK